MANIPSFAATPVLGIGQVSVANANRDGTGTLVTLVTAGANGARIDYISVKAVGAVSNGMVRIFVTDGANTRLLTEIEVASTTPSATQKTFEQLVEMGGGIVLAAGQVLKASTEVGETMNVFAMGGQL